MTKFWFVMVDDTVEFEGGRIAVQCSGTLPRVRHRSEKDACAEAERLARENPGKTFIVLVAVMAVQKTDLVWNKVIEDSSQIPF